MWKCSLVILRAQGDVFLLIDCLTNSPQYRDIKKIKTPQLHVYQARTTDLTTKTMSVLPKDFQINFLSINWIVSPLLLLKEVLCLSYSNVYIMLITLNVLKHTSKQRGLPARSLSVHFLSLFWPASVALFKGLQAKQWFWDSTKNSGATSKKKKTKEWCVPSEYSHPVKVLVLFAWLTSVKRQIQVWIHEIWGINY